MLWCFFFCFFPPVALLSWHKQPRHDSSISNGGREQQCVALCCKLATWFCLQRFTFRGTRWITPKPCQNNWNANQTPRGDFGLLGSSNLPSPVLWQIFVERNIDFGSTFCKYLPHGHQKGLSIKTKGKKNSYVCLDFGSESLVWFGHVGYVLFYNFSISKAQTNKALSFQRHYSWWCGNEGDFTDEEESVTQDKL